MIIVDNSKGSDIDQQTLQAYKKIKAWSEKPPENVFAMRWIKSQQR
jgi:hypothetical protein